MVLLRTCPSVNTPVTLGGGMTMEYAGLRECASATKNFCSSQYAYHFSSTDCGSYVFEISGIECARGRQAQRPFSSRRYSMESTSASRLASMILSLTPTVPHSSRPSLDWMRTRVLAAVPVLESRIRTL